MMDKNIIVEEYAIYLDDKVELNEIFPINGLELENLMDDLGLTMKNTFNMVGNFIDGKIDVLNRVVEMEDLDDPIYLRYKIVSEEEN